MGDCCGNQVPTTCSNPAQHFSRMLANCLQFANEERAAGKPIVGIMCEYTPREIIMAAGAVPVCLCGGSARTIPTAEEQLPPNLCPLIKSTYGYHLLRSNPFLEMASLIVAETTCDGKKKMYELMGETRPMYVLSLPQKSASPEGLSAWTHELRGLVQELENRFGVEITDAKLRTAIHAMNRERELRRALAELMKRDDPPLSGRDLLRFKSSISCIPQDIHQYEAALFAYKNTSSCSQNRPRVLITGVPIVEGAERVVDIIEDCGAAVVAFENCTGLKPIVDDVDASATDPLTAIAAKYYALPCSVMTHNSQRIDLLERLARDYKADCIVDLVWQACLTYSVEGYYVKKLSENILKLPYLRIETDYSPSDTERIRTRVQAILELVIARKGVAACS